MHRKFRKTLRTKFEQQKDCEEELSIADHAPASCKQVAPLYVGHAHIRDNQYDPYALYTADGCLLAIGSDNWSPQWATLFRRLAAAFNFCEDIPLEVLESGRQPEHSGDLQDTLNALAEDIIVGMGDVFYDGDDLRDGIECDECGAWTAWDDNDSKTHLCPQCEAWVGTPNERQHKHVKDTIVWGLEQLVAMIYREIAGGHRPLPGETDASSRDLKTTRTNTVDPERMFNVLTRLAHAQKTGCRVSLSAADAGTLLNALDAAMEHIKDLGAVHCQQAATTERIEEVFDTQRHLEAAWQDFVDSHDTNTIVRLSGFDSLDEAVQAMVEV